MALAPQNEETFFREVDEELRRDRLQTFFTRYGVWVAVAVVLFLAAIGGWLYWQHRQTLAAGKEGEVLTQALADLAAGQQAGVAAALKPLEDSPREGYRAAALLTEASAAQARDDRTAAVAGFKAVAQDDAFSQPMRDAALIRQTALEYDALPPQAVIDRLKGLAVAGSPWFGSAGEMVAIAYMRSNRPQLAGPIFAAIAKNETMPETLRARAVRAAGALGVDAIPERRGESASR